MTGSIKAKDSTKKGQKKNLHSNRIAGPPVRKVDIRAMHRMLTWLLENNRRQGELINSALEIIEKDFK